MHKVSGSCRPEHGNFVSTHSSVQMSLEECKHFFMPRYKQNSESFERKFMQKLAHKVSSLVQNFPIPGHNWKLDMDRALKKYFRYFFFSVAIKIIMRVISRFAIKVHRPRGLSEKGLKSKTFQNSTGRQRFFFPRKE